jgi:hypothetical protein
LRLPRQERVLWLGVFAVWAMCSMAVTWEYHKDTWLVYGIALAHCRLLYSRPPQLGQAMIPRNMRMQNGRQRGT